MNAIGREDLELARRLMPAIIREHAATSQGVLTFWRQVMGDMHAESEIDGWIDAAAVAGWIEKLDFLLKVATDASDALVRELRTAGYSQQMPSGGVNLGQWRAPN